MLLSCGVGEDSWESLGQQGDPTSPSYRRSVLSVHWRDWCWSWNSNTLATWCEELTHLKRPWCWERLRAGGEGDDRGWDGCTASSTWWTWVWVDSGCWWWTGRPGVLRFMGLQRVGHDWATELNWVTYFMVVCKLCVCSVMSNSLWLYGLYVACQAPLFMQFSRQECWSRLPFPTPGNLPYPGIKAVSCISCSGRLILHHCATWEAHVCKLLVSKM